MKDTVCKTIAQTAKDTGLSQSYIRAGCKNGSIPCVMIGNKYMINYPLFIDQINAQSVRRGTNG